MLEILQSAKIKKMEQYYVGLYTNISGTMVTGLKLYRINSTYSETDFLKVPF